MVLINKHTGKIIAEYSGDKVQVVEEDWMDVVVKNHALKKPNRLKIATSNLNISTNADSVIQLDNPSQTNGQPLGFVDFMAFQPKKAKIKYKTGFETGSSFFEYMITYWGISANSQNKP